MQISKEQYDKLPERLQKCFNKGNYHSTVKPLKLLEYLCTLTATPTGGIVLDPFCGSGSTGIACINTDRQFIGIEMDEGYMEIAKARIKHACKQD